MSFSNLFSKKVHFFSRGFKDVWVELVGSESKVASQTHASKTSKCLCLCHWAILRFSAGEIGVPSSKTPFSRLFLVLCSSLHNTNYSGEGPIHQAYMRSPNTTQILANSDQSFTKPCPSRWKQRKKKWWSLQVRLFGSISVMSIQLNCL